MRDMSSDEKESSFQELLNTIESSDVAVFGFMDYWTFDGYIQFIDYLNHNNIKITKTIFPGMELRIEAPVDYRLNIHVLLSNSLTIQQLEDFKSQLTIGSLDRRISDESIVEFAKSLDASKAKHHGFDDPKSLSPNQLLQLGSSTIVITKESLRKAMTSVPAGTAYIILPYDTSDGLLKLDWKSPRRISGGNYLQGIWLPVRCPVGRGLQRRWTACSEENAATSINCLAAAESIVFRE